VASILPIDEAGLLGYARAIVSCGAGIAFAGSCGARTLPARSGHVLVCSDPACRNEQFPRIDPAIIVLVSDGERALLGRQASWPAGRYSTIAGFVEPGESLEDAVAREVFEETGIAVDQIDYHSSQPWPFPASLMLGFTAHAVTSEVRLRDQELEDARWFTPPTLFRTARCLPPRQSISFRPDRTLVRCRRRRAPARHSREFALDTIALGGSLALSFVLCAAFFAGFIDAIVGGGGLIQVPALFAGYPGSSPPALLGTNKLGSICGTSGALLRYLRVVQLPRRVLLPAAAVAFVAALAGASLVSAVSPALFRPLLPVMLTLVLIYVLHHKDLGARHAPIVLSRRRGYLALTAIGGIGMYDGFFGPGTGSFLMCCSFGFMALISCTPPPAPAPSTSPPMPARCCSSAFMAIFTGA